MKHSAARDRYFAQEVLPFAGNPEEPTRFIGVFADSGVALLCVAYAVLPLYVKKPGKK